MVHSGCGADVTSAAATLTVNPATSITTQPTSQTLCAGSNATFTVVAAGTAPITYQWKKGASNIVGATSASLTLNNITAADAASYTVVVHSGCGADVTSAAATLTVNAATSITTQPASQTVCTGSNATFTVVAAGTAPITYQWKKGGTDIVGATSASLTLNSVTAADAASYTVLVHSGCGADVTSSAAVLTVNPSTSITTQPTNQIACAGSNATFTVVAAGTAPITYQWKKGASNIVGATSASLTLNNVTAADAASYTVVVHSGCGADVTSAAATLTVNAATSITTQPTSQTLCAGSNATFTVVASGTGTITYQWKKGASNIVGATSASLTINNISAADAASYTVVVHSDCGADVTSSAAVLTVNPSTSITTQPTNQTACAGSNATFTVVAAGTAPITYQWKKGATNIVGATSASLTLNSVTAADAASYTVLVHSGCGADVTSSAATLTVNPATSITTQPTSQTLCAGSNATFTVVAAGTAPITYQWKKGGIEYSRCNECQPNLK